MVDLATEYLGLKLAHPLVPSASPLSKDLDSARRLEDAGAAAIVLPSLFEEKIEAEQQQMERFLFGQGIGYGEADSFHPLPPQILTYQEQYLEHLQRLKSALQIPVIASLNGTSVGGWIEYGKALQDAGADALELNIYHLAADIAESSETVENRYLDIVRELKRQINIPLAVKLSPQFSSPLHFVQRLQQAGADGVALFNRFYQPDIDLETLEVVPKLQLSTPAEALLRVRWTALMYGRVPLSLAVTGGFHQAEDVIKALLAGADVVHLCSVLLAQGVGKLDEIRNELAHWLIEHEYESVAQMKGSVSRQHAIDPGAYERANYIHVLDSYTPAPGVLR
ncbi:dihydroorotate dehydrogenase-like protein [Methylomonas koyamae]|uniref:Dihydroorotate dehydrogenase n=1 Tax=Methylomonas koyamae TaxID=702114 RepID=A0A291IM72_9GAMM|nr:dihydroorotate dehydrogenase-like protein [Methylomonas koyamae]ATG91369.1 dihydroorotate dehydrogenase [Methylomonas koyamae]OAI24732.1 dihydroorotate dehydrogenase [Methylomonas koyamae]WNB77082.1 dihydroorotate dehydrogenase-like protein [Methylomonas koyamae]